MDQKPTITCYRCHESNWWKPGDERTWHKVKNLHDKEQATVHLCGECYNILKKDLEYTIESFFKWNEFYWEEGCNCNAMLE